MATHYTQGSYSPKNPSKYIGKKLPYYRSGWEYKVFLYLDMHPNIIGWASEPVAIPYVNPITGLQSNYYPDLLVQFIEKNGQTKVEMFEIKPAAQTFDESAKGANNKAQLLVNKCKWAAAGAWCAKRGISFRVLTEKDLFKTRSKKRK